MKTELVRRQNEKIGHVVRYLESDILIFGGQDQTDSYKGFVQLFRINSVTGAFTGGNTYKPNDAGYSYYQAKAINYMATGKLVIVSYFYDNPINTWWSMLKLYTLDPINLTLT